MATTADMLDGESEKWLATGFGSAGGLYLLARWVFRWFGKDKLEFTKDRVETDIVTGQYLRIRELEGKNTELVSQLLEKAQEVGMLRGQVEALTYHSKLQDLQIEHLKENIKALTAQIEPLLAMLRNKPAKVVELATREIP